MTESPQGRLAASVAVLIFCLPLAAVACVGCGRGRAGESPGSGKAVLNEVNSAYVNHLRSNRYRAPADEAEFKTILKQAGDGALKRAGVATVDQLLVSPRDSQPFVIRYGKDAGRFLERGVVAHEKTGVAGRRLVGFDLGYVKEVDEEEFKQLLPER